MTIPNENIENNYVGNGVATTFAYTFPIFEDADIVVTRADTDGVETVLTLGTDYTVTGAGLSTGGNVVLSSALASNYLLNVTSNTAKTQTYDIRSNPTYRPDNMERALDRQVRMIQEVGRETDKAVRLAVTQTGVNPRLPLADAGKLIGWKEDGTGLDNFSQVPEALVGSAMEAVMTADTLAEARYLLGPFGGTLYIDDFGGDLYSAIMATPTGGILQLGHGPYVANISVTRSDITIRGVGMPWYATDKKSLVGGTVIQGTLGLTGDRITIESLGIDCGLNVCTAINGGVAMDCLVLNDALRIVHYNCVVRDVITLCKDATSAAHNFLLEGLSDSRFENLHARYGWWGIVMKTLNSTADGLYAYATNQAGVTVKSDSYAYSYSNTITNVVCLGDDGNSGATGIFLYAATYSMRDVALSNFFVQGFVEGVKLTCDTRARNVNLMKNISITGGCIRGCTTFGFTSFGAVANVVVSNLTVEDVVSGNSIKVWSDSYGVHFSNVIASAPAGVNNITNVDLAGRFTFNNLHSCVTGDYGTPAGINCVPESRATFKIGSYIGTLAFSGVAAAFTTSNGWTSYFSTLAIRAQSGQARLCGRAAVPGTPWTGKEKIGSIPSNLAPNTAKYVTGLGWNGTGAPPVPVYITINQNGDITADFLNTPTSFPATIGWVGLDGISWQIPE